MGRDACDDARFVLREMLDAAGVLRALPAFAEVDASLIDEVARAAHAFADAEIAPLNAAADREGCRLDGEGNVTTPTGFAAAWQRFAQAGWPLLAAHPDDGGQGLPRVVETVLHEAVSAACPGWDMTFAILHGGYACLRAHGSEALRARYLADLAAGRATITMAMTEPDAGSDLGRCRTRAVPAADGSARLEGTKIFISGADHDWTDQIVHLVLARSEPDAPGTRGLSLFAVPRRLPDGTRNAARVVRLERKMGLHGSPTCELRFDGATGWLVGERGRGLAALFVMMNAARIVVGLQAVGAAAAALAQAGAYAAQRVQGGVPVLRHPPVQRLLAQSRAWTEGGRMLALATALRLDESAEHPEAAVREAALREVSLLTPIVKALLTEQCFAAVNACLQVYGGHGYVADHGIEQRVRDLRVALLYEGTNEIQALDLWQRKLAGDGGRTLREVLDRLSQGPVTPLRAQAQQAAARLIGTVGPMLAGAGGVVPAGLVAPAALKACGLVVQAALWARADDAAATQGDTPFARRKRATARVFFAHLLPELDALLRQLEELSNDAQAALQALAEATADEDAG